MRASPIENPPSGDSMPIRQHRTCESIRIQHPNKSKTDRYGVKSVGEECVEHRLQINFCFIHQPNEPHTNTQGHKNKGKKQQRFCYPIACRKVCVLSNMSSSKATVSWWRFLSAARQNQTIEVVWDNTRTCFNTAALGDRHNELIIQSAGPFDLTHPQPTPLVSLMQNRLKEVGGSSTFGCRTKSKTARRIGMKECRKVRTKSTCESRRHPLVLATWRKRDATFVNLQFALDGAMSVQCLTQSIVSKVKCLGVATFDL